MKQEKFPLNDAEIACRQFRIEHSEKQCLCPGKYTISV